ncbi:MAG: HEPN domain-containing protein [Chloroflexi bacterium]|nr:HEPN domain-containing protein [Chloroflexota bacterium]
MNRRDLQRLSNTRLMEAKVLLDNRHYSGAYYLLGYSVECALKACIAKRVQRHDFPDRQTVNDSYTHNLQLLLKVSGLEVELDQARSDNHSLNTNWSTVKDWTVDSRYDYEMAEATVRDLYTAVVARSNGILAWLKQRW